jgi:hypothetical protein
MNRAMALALGWSVVALVSTAHAQYPVYGGWGNGPPSASTVGQSYAMGMADLVQAAGQAHLSNSQAAINLEQANSMNLDNQIKGTQTYFEMRKMNTSYRKAEQSPGLTTEDSWRVAQMNMPKRLNSTQLDPVTGKIYWPMMFQDPRYENYRKQLDQLFVQRETSHGGIGYDTFMQIQQVTDSLLADLQKNISQYDPQQYISMKKFVESLAYEAKMPAV